MIFQIEENLAPRGHQIANHLRAFGSIKLHADFVGLDGVAKSGNNFQGFPSGRDIERNDQPLTLWESLLNEFKADWKIW